MHGKPVGDGATETSNPETLVTQCDKERKNYPIQIKNENQVNTAAYIRGGKGWERRAILNRR